MVKVKEIEPYAKEWTRKHVRDLGYRTFYHPSYGKNGKDITIVTKDGEVLGMVGTVFIQRNNSRSREILENRDFMPFSF